MNVLDFDIKEYCYNCRLGKVRPFHLQCQNKCKYSREDIRGQYSGYGYRCIDFKKGNKGIYFIKCDKYVKIGSTIDIEERLAIMRRNNPFDLQVLLYLDNLDLKIEFAFHKYFSDYRHRNEWFFYDKKIKKFIEAPVSIIKKTTKKIVYEISKSELDIFENKTKGEL